MNFKYNMSPADLGIDISHDAEIRWCLGYAARRSQKQSRREFAASLLSQFGQWSDKQSRFANAIWISHVYQWRMFVAEECRTRSVVKFIADVGVDAATAYADSLRADADVLRGMVHDGKEYADSHDRYSDRYWNSIQYCADQKCEIADRITRLAANGVAA